MAKGETARKDVGADLKVTQSTESPLSEVISTGNELSTAHVIDHHAERALCFKLDTRILPVLAFMFVIL